MGERPKRIQRQRTRGWKAPEGAIYVGRGSKYGNPFVVGAPYFVVDMHKWMRGQPLSEAMWKTYTAVDAVECYKRWLREQVGRSGFALTEEAKTELRGRDLICWCGPFDVCHAGWLLKLANPELFTDVP